MLSDIPITDQYAQAWMSASASYLPTKSEPEYIRKASLKVAHWVFHQRLLDQTTTYLITRLPPTPSIESFMSC